MSDWIRAQLTAGLPALAGTSLSGTIVVKQELINELLGDWLAGAGTGTGSTSPDIRNVVRYVTNAAVRAEPGRLLLDFAFAVPRTE
jgi:hypothetical protein